MAKKAPLTVKQVDALKEPGVWWVSPRLYLQVTGEGGRSWLMRYMLDGTSHDMGLGSCAKVSLAKARGKVQVALALLGDGLDPLDARRRQKRERVQAKATAVTFKECAEKYIAAHEAGWKNGKHRAQWSSTLATYVYPAIGEMPVSEVDTPHVMAVIEPLWHSKTETANRVRGRVESVLDWAKASGYRTGENPAAWRGHLDQLLPARGKVAPVEHHEAVDYAAVPAFMAELRQRDGTSARCLEFTVLTWTRSGEARGARWDEIDFAKRTWAVPASRMKAAREHTIPLSPAALGLLQAMPRTGDLVFEGAREGRPISDMSMTMVMRRMGRTETVHGFRSAAKDWASETTSHPDIVSEMALAHAIPDKVQKAYRRGTLQKKRTKLMNDWARYCEGGAK